MHLPHVTIFSDTTYICTSSIQINIHVNTYTSSSTLHCFWDTYAFWRTNFYTNYNVSIKEIHPKWNFVNGYRDHELSEKHQKVIHHYTIPVCLRIE